jgi:hypothetical protein
MLTECLTIRKVLMWILKYYYSFINLFKMYQLSMDYLTVIRHNPDLSVCNPEVNRTKKFLSWRIHSHEEADDKEVNKKENSVIW